MKSGRLSDFKIQMTEKLELPKDIMLGAVLLHLTGQSEIEIENFKGILCFSQEQIVLSIPHGTIEIYGSNLDIKHYSKEEIKIRGNIQSIKYDH